MRVITLNANGIRAAARKGFYHWLRRQKADILCLQELKAQEDQLQASDFWPRNWHCYYECAERKGYSGVGLYSRREPDEVLRGFGSAEFDAEGRYLEARFGPLSVVSLYLPSGSSSEQRQEAKWRFLAEFTPLLAAARDSGRQYLLCGDFNIAHREIDLKNWRGNRKNSGFLPEERAWMDMLFGELGIRGLLSPDQPPIRIQYTWWSNRGRLAEERGPGASTDGARQTVIAGTAREVPGSTSDGEAGPRLPLILD